MTIQYIKADESDCLMEMQPEVAHKPVNTAEIQ